MPKARSLGRDLPEVVEAFVNEAFANVRQHAAATTVHVDVALRTGRLCVSVRDDGCGICAARLQRRAPGGLARSAGLARAAGGSLTAEARAIGGTVLRLSLPLPHAP